jgi:hypothetical protein
MELTIKSQVYHTAQPLYTPFEKLAIDFISEDSIRVA